MNGFSDRSIDPSINQPIKKVGSIGELVSQSLINQNIDGQQEVYQTVKETMAFAFLIRLWNAKTLLKDSVFIFYG